jgi:hypothetical protein
MMHMETVSTPNVCSLGSLCHSSALLKRNKLKQVSYPFDWIFSNPKVIAHCLDDDFRIFLDKSYYISVDEEQCKHSYYATPEFGNDTNSAPLFRHHNPLTNPSDYNYFCRCVVRFRKLLQSKSYKLFTILFVNCPNNDTNDITELENCLERYTTNYEILVIHHRSGSYEPLHTISYIDNIHRMNLHTKTVSDGIRFADDCDNRYLDDFLITSYADKLRKKWTERLLDWIKRLFGETT